MLNNPTRRLLRAASPWRCWRLPHRRPAPPRPGQGQAQAASPAHRAAAGDATARIAPPPAEPVTRHEITHRRPPARLYRHRRDAAAHRRQGRDHRRDLLRRRSCCRRRRPIAASADHLSLQRRTGRRLRLSRHRRDRAARARISARAARLPPPSDRVADNPDTWLPFTDLVFIDPVGTGYSRATGGDEAAAKQFLGCRPGSRRARRHHPAPSGAQRQGSSRRSISSARAMAASAPRGLPTTSTTDRGIATEGVIMVSPVIDFGLMGGGPLDPLPCALRLPSYAAAKLGAKSLEPGALGDGRAIRAARLSGRRSPRDRARARRRRHSMHKLAQLTGLDSRQPRSSGAAASRSSNYLRDMRSPRRARRQPL